MTRPLTPKEIQEVLRWQQERDRKELEQITRRAAENFIRSFEASLQADREAEIRARYAKLGLTGSPQETQELFQSANTAPELSREMTDKITARFLQEEGLDQPLPEPAPLPEPTQADVRTTTDPMKLISMGLKAKDEQEKNR